MEGAKEIERKLTGEGSAQHLNEISLLYQLAESSDLKVVAEALSAIPRVLAFHRRTAGSAASGTAGAPDLADWLSRCDAAYHSALSQLVVSSNLKAQGCGVRLAFAAYQEEAEERRISSVGAGDRSTLDGIVSGLQTRISGLLSALLLASAWPEQAVRCLAAEFLRPFADVRHDVLAHLRTCLDQVGQRSAHEPREAKRRRLLPFAEQLGGSGLEVSDFLTRSVALLRLAPEPGPGTILSESGAPTGDAGDGGMLLPHLRSRDGLLKGYRRLFQDTWLQLLNLPVPLSAHKELFQFLPLHVIPHLSQPLMMSGFYIRAFHCSRLEMSVLALSGLLLLINRYGLGDSDGLSSSAASDYFTHLYSLVRPEAFKLRQRARFLRLLEASLTKSMSFPQRFAALFAKRLMRCATQLGDAGTVMWIMALTHRLIQLHPAHCKYLLHRPEVDPEVSLLADPFDDSAPLAVAVETMPLTSLWELQMIRRHPVPAVATLAKMFEKPFFLPTSKQLSPDTFLDQSSEEMFRQALRAGQRQAERWEQRGTLVPMAFEAPDDGLEFRLMGWMASLSTWGRKLKL